MKKWKKGISALLSIALLCTLLPVGVLAAEKSDGNVIFLSDFESMNVGDLIAQDRNDVNGWYTVTMNTEVATFTCAEEKGRGKVLKLDNFSDAYSGTKLMKYINLAALSNVRVSYEYKGDSPISFSFSDGVTTHTVKTKKSADWNQVIIDIDVANSTYQATIGGEKGEKIAFEPFANMTKIQFIMGCGINAGLVTYIDNIVFTTTDDITAAAAQSDKTAAHPANQKHIEAAQKALEEKLNITFEAAPKQGINVPAGQNLIVLDDCESYGEVMTYTNWSIVGNKTYVNPGKDGGNQFISIANTDSEIHTPRFNRPLKNLRLNTMTYELDFAGNPAFDLIVYVKNNAKSVTLARPTEPYLDGKWHHIKVDVSFADKKAVAYIDGAEYATSDLSALMTADAWDTMEMQISAQLNAGAKGRMDNIVAYTPDSVAGATFDYQNNINWDAIKAKNPTGLTEIVREEHPRLILNDWDEIREKIKNEYWCGVWWDSVKSTADYYIAEDTTVTYRVNERGNIQETSQEIRIKAYVLSFVAGVTGERKYAEQLYKILKHVHDTFPDWSENLALLSANFIAAYAYSYDWAYDVFTPEERADVLRMTMNRGATIAVQGYENKLAEAYNTMMKKGNNQTSTANRANICLAIAIATDYPEIAEYLLDNAATGMPNVFYEFFPDGGFIETTDYWDASATDIIQSISALESCIKPGTTLPERLDWANSIEGFINTGDFPIYYNGATSSFKYGDTTSRFI
ncbi:MAG: hypothetical protein IJD83_05045, partial [Clostridia bacterium]|nr:hypothetical protein [Clostridia bacterium]